MFGCSNINNIRAGDLIGNPLEHVTGEITISLARDHECGSLDAGHFVPTLTKRAERLGQLGPHLPWKPWMWAGVTVESDKYIHRIDHLKKLPENVNKFLMFEPLLGPIPKLNLA